MATQNTPSTLSAYLKEVYADQILTLFPEGIRVLEAVPFVESEKEPGGHYNQPVQLTQEFGFSTGTGAFALNAAIAHVPQNAQVNGTSLLLRSVISYDAAARASTNKKAFMKWSESKFIPMLISYKKRLEILCIYGQKSIGQVSAVSVSGANVTVTLTNASWANGIWAGSENMTIDAYSALTSGTKRTAGGTASVSSVSLANKQVTLACANSTDAGNVAVNDYLFFGSFYSTNEMAGLAMQVNNQSSTLFGISASTYALWSGNQYDCKSAPLTMGKVLAGLALAAGKGLEEKTTLLTSPGAFANLNADQSALRKYDESYSKKKLENGTEALTFHGVTGSVDVLPSIYVKEGHAIAFPAGQCLRLGGSDITMTMPGQSADQLVLQVPDVAAYEMRLYSEQAMFLQRPGWGVEFINIVNQ